MTYKYDGDQEDIIGALKVWLNYITLSHDIRCIFAGDVARTYEDIAKLVDFVVYDSADFVVYNFVIYDFVDFVVYGFVVYDSVDFCMLT